MALLWGTGWDLRSPPRRIQKGEWSTVVKGEDGEGDDPRKGLEPESPTVDQSPLTASFTPVRLSVLSRPKQVPGTTQR